MRCSAGWGLLPYTSSGHLILICDTPEDTPVVRNEAVSLVPLPEVRMTILVECTQIPTMS